jgi:hypothetical protein
MVLLEQLLQHAVSQQQVTVRWLDTRAQIH